MRGIFGIHADGKCGGETPRKVKSIFEGVILQLTLYNGYIGFGNFLPRKAKTPKASTAAVGRPMSDARICEAINPHNIGFLTVFQLQYRLAPPAIMAPPAEP